MKLRLQKIINEAQSLMLSILKTIVFLVLDSVCVTLSIVLALCFRFGSYEDIPAMYVDFLPMYALWGIMFSSGLLLASRNYETNMIKFNILDSLKTAATLLIGYLIVLIFFSQISVPLSPTVAVNYIYINTLLFGTYRLFIRAGTWMYVRYVLNFFNKKKTKNILIIGAGNAGQYLASMLMYEPKENSKVVGFIDDNNDLWGRRIKGLKVFGGRKYIPTCAEKYNISEIIVAIPHVDNSTIREIFSYCAKANCSIKRFANMSTFTEAGLSRATINDVHLEDLLGRTEIKLDLELVRELLNQKIVLITGGAGSIGSEICRQVLSCGAAKAVIFDINENGIFEICNELSVKYGDKFAAMVGSVRDPQRLKEVFALHSPDVVFHAAAHKHVPIMERNPFEAIINNSFGTYNTAMAAVESGAERFILISTDKAVNPTNYMGASKRIAELVVQSMNGSGKTIFSAVRFGNVLGSNGSVIPLFKKQIEAGGPVTVTDKTVTRYFMTIPEAVHLVLDVSAIMTGSEIFVLNMGVLMNIYDLACTMIRLSGLIPEKDIPIKITGLREGEKLYEELNLDSENVDSTTNDQIFVLKPEPCSSPSAEALLKGLKNASDVRDITMLNEAIRALVPGFLHN